MALLRPRPSPYLPTPSTLPPRTSWPPATSALGRAPPSCSQDRRPSLYALHRSPADSRLLHRPSRRLGHPLAPRSAHDASASQASAQPATARPQLRRLAQRALRRFAAVRLTGRPSHASPRAPPVPTRLPNRSPMRRCSVRYLTSTSAAVCPLDIDLIATQVHQIVPKDARAEVRYDGYRALKRPRYRRRAHHHQAATRQAAVLSAGVSQACRPSAAGCLAPLSPGRARSARWPLTQRTTRSVEQPMAAR